MGLGNLNLRLTGDNDSLNTVLRAITNEKNDILIELEAKNKIVADLQVLLLGKMNDQQENNVLKEENAWLVKQLATRENKLKKINLENLESEDSIIKMRNQYENIISNLKNDIDVKDTEYLKQLDKFNKTLEGNSDVLNNRDIKAKNEIENLKDKLNENDK